MKVSAGMGFVWLPAVRTKESASQHRQDVFTSFGSQKTSHGSRCTGNSVAKLPGDIRSQLTHNPLHVLWQDRHVTLESRSMPAATTLPDSLKEKLAA